MKKIKIVMTVLQMCLIFCLMPMIASASQTDGKLSLSVQRNGEYVTEINTGDIITVTVNLDYFKSTIAEDEEKLLTTMQFFLPFDENVFEYVDGSMSNAQIYAVNVVTGKFADANIHNYTLKVAALYKNVQSGAIQESEEPLELLSFQLKVKETANQEQVTLDFTDIYLKNLYLEEEYSSSSEGISLNIVKQDPENPNEPEEPEDPDNPDKPEEPEDPDNPDKPEEPKDPNEPDEPEEPKDPEISEVDKKALEDKITALESENIVAENYTFDSYAVYHTKLAHAKEVCDNENASQEEVNIALEELTAAYLALQKIADKTVLNAKISEMEAISGENYTQESYHGLADAIATAKELQANREASQESVDAAVTALEEARNALVRKEEGDKTDNPEGNEKPGETEKPGIPEKPEDKNEPSDTDKPNAPTQPDNSQTIQLAKPTMVKAMSTSYNKIKLSWKKVNGATGYEIYLYNTVSKKYLPIKTVSPNSMVHTKLKTGTTYRYKIRAYVKKDGKIFYSEYSKIVSAKPKLASTKVTIKNTKAGKITLSWKKTPGASGYMIYRATSPKGAYRTIKTVKNTSYVNTGLKKGKTYFYKILPYRMVNGKKVKGTYSTVKSVKVKK